MKRIFGILDAFVALLAAVAVGPSPGDAAELAERDLENPHLFYRAGVIAAAAGDTSTARRHLTEALAINLAFDVIRTPADAYDHWVWSSGRSRTSADGLLGPDKGEVTGSTPVSPT